LIFGFNKNAFYPGSEASASHEQDEAEASLPIIQSKKQAFYSQIMKAL